MGETRQAQGVGRQMWQRQTLGLGLRSRLKAPGGSPPPARLNLNQEGRVRKHSLRREQGISMAFFALVMALLAVPLMSVAVDLSRYTWIRSVLQRGADAAAEAAVQRIDIEHFQKTGAVRFEIDAQAEAVRVASAHVSPLLASMVYPSLDYVILDESNATVHVGLSANSQLLITAGRVGTTVRVDGIAQLRMRQSVGP